MGQHGVSHGDAQQSPGGDEADQDPVRHDAGHARARDWRPARTPGRLILRPEGAQDQGIPRARQQGHAHHRPKHHGVVRVSPSQQPRLGSLRGARRRRVRRSVPVHRQRDILRVPQG